MNEVEMEHRLTAVEKLAGSNKHRIDEAEENNKALQDLSKSIASANVWTPAVNPAGWKKIT